MKFYNNIKKTFYDWCIENDRQCYLDIWDYELNDFSPKEVGYTSKKEAYFKCENNQHPSFLRIVGGLKDSKEHICPYCNSFYEWCIKNNHQDYLEAWDYERNKEDIHTISRSSGKKLWFNVKDASYQYTAANITSSTPNQDPISRYYNSFGYYLLENFGEDAIKNYWSKKNQKTPYDYTKSSTQKIWIKCLEKEYHEDYETSPEQFKRGYRCVYCASKIIHLKDSFGTYWSDTFPEWYNKCWASDNEVDPFSLAIRNHSTQIHIQCPNIEYHDWWTTPERYMSNSIENGTCPFCSGHRVHENDSLGKKYPKVLDLWSDKNEKSPYEYTPFSSQRVWWKCDNNIHQDYKRKITDGQKADFNCPECVKHNHISKIEQITYDYLSFLGYTVLTEYNCSIIPINPKTNMRLPLDNEVKELRLIIEVHGEQHYNINSFHKHAAKERNMSPKEIFEYSKWKDEYKRNYVISQNYYYLELPYWTFDEKETYKLLINNKIQEIKNNQESVTTAGVA